MDSHVGPSDPIDYDGPYDRPTRLTQEPKEDTVQTNPDIDALAPFIAELLEERELEDALVSKSLMPREDARHYAKGFYAGKRAAEERGMYNQ